MAVDANPFAIAGDSAIAAATPVPGAGDAAVTGGPAATGNVRGPSEGISTQEGWGADTNGMTTDERVGWLIDRVREIKNEVGIQLGGIKGKEIEVVEGI